MLTSWIRKLFGTPTRPIINRRTVLELETLEDRALPSAAIPIDTATLALNNSAINENEWSGTLVGNFSQHIAGASGYTSYQLVSGAGSTNNNKFTIAGDQLRTKAAFNFEAQSTFSIRVKATAANGVTSTEQFTITVNDVNEAPTNLALGGTKSVKENSAAGTLVGLLTAKEADVGDVLTYSLVDSANGRFQINGNRLEVADNANLDFEQQQSFYVRIRATDSAGLATEQGYQIAITNVNEAPTGLTLYGNSIAENSPTGSYVGTIAAQDPDGTTPTLSLVNSAGGRFAISGNNLVVANGTLLNHESATSHQVTIRARDASGLYTQSTFTINVTNVNEAPTNIALSNASITLPADAGTLVGNLSATDADANQQFTYILTDNAGGKFQINGSRLEITNSDLFKWDPKGSYNISVMVLDQGGASFQKTFAIAVTNAAQTPANQAPNSITLNGSTVAENSPTGTYIGWLSANDPDSYSPPTLTLVDSAGGRFKLSGNNLVVNNGALLNYEGTTSYQVTIRATDAGGLTFDRTFTITLTNANEAPTSVTLSNASLGLPTQTGTVVGIFSASDPDNNDQFTYILTDNAGGKFQMIGANLVVTDPKLFKWDAKPSYSIHLLVLDQGGLSYEKWFTVGVTGTQI